MEDKDIQVLVFHRDKDDKNWISRLANGKIAILHRADPTTVSYTHLTLPTNREV